MVSCRRPGRSSCTSCARTCCAHDVAANPSTRCPCSWLAVASSCLCMCAGPLSTVVLRFAAFLHQLCRVLSCVLVYVSLRVCVSVRAAVRCLCDGCSRINEMLPKEEFQDGPPELLFLHAGHTSRVSDICWSARLSVCLLWLPVCLNIFMCL